MSEYQSDLINKLYQGQVNDTSTQKNTCQDLSRQNQFNPSEDSISENRHHHSFCNRILLLQQSQKIGDWDQNLMNGIPIYQESEMADLQDSQQSKRKLQGKNIMTPKKLNIENIDKSQQIWEENDQKDFEEVKHEQNSIIRIERSTVQSEEKFFRSSKKQKQSKKEDTMQIDQEQETNFPLKDKTFDNSSSRIWKVKWMQIFYYVWKFKKLAMQSQMFFRPDLLRKVQVRLIGDKGSGLYKQQFQMGNTMSNKEQSEEFSYAKYRRNIKYRNYRKRIKIIENYLQLIFIQIKQVKWFYYKIMQIMLQHVPLFHYLSGLYIIWETLIFLSSSILFLYIPFEYSFRPDRNQYIQIYIQTICPIIFGLDIFVRANTKTIESGSFIENHIYILHKYIQSDFIPDIFSLLSLNNHFFGIKATYFFFFIRFQKSFRAIRLFREFFLLKTQIQGMISLLLLLGQILYFAHLISCIWYSVGMSEVQYNQGWILKYDVLNQPEHIRYLRSFYYSIITMTTIGYGDVTPQSDIEKLTVVFIAFFSCGLFGYSINLIGSILSDLKYKSDRHLQEVAKINKYFKQNKVDLELQAKARQHLDYLFSDKKEDRICSVDQLSSLSEYLRNEIKVNVFTKRMKNIKIFREIFSDSTLSQLALIVDENIYYPDQYIVDINSNREPILYFIQSGSVLQFASKKHNKTGKLIKIPLNKFLEVIKKNEEEYEKFTYIKDQLIFNHNYSAVHLSCYSCQQKSHHLLNCPFIYYSGKKQILLRQHLQKINETIRHFKRKEPKVCYYHSLLNQKQITEQALLFFQINYSCTMNEFMCEQDEQTESEIIDFNENITSEKLNENSSLEEINSNQLIFNSIDQQQNQFKQEKLPFSKNEYLLISKKQSSCLDEENIISEGVQLNSTISALTRLSQNNNEKSLTPNSEQDINDQQPKKSEKVPCQSSKKISNKEMNSYIKIIDYNNETSIQMIPGVKDDKRNSKRSSYFENQLSSLIERIILKRLQKEKYEKSTVMERLTNVTVIPDEEQDNLQTSLFMYDFDISKIFQYYFSQSNYHLVIERIQPKVVIKNLLTRKSMPNLKYKPPIKLLS